MPHPQPKVHRMFELVEPIATVTFSEVPNEAFLALGMRNYWGGYFAGRAAPFGMAPAAVVHAIFYNFADGEVARHIPWVWGKTTPEQAIAVRERSSTAALRQMIGELADSPDLVRVADLAIRAAVSAPTEGGALYAGLRALDAPQEPAARLWHAATMLREHRGDGHNDRLCRCHRQPGDRATIHRQRFNIAEPRREREDAAPPRWSNTTVRTTTRQ